MPAEWTVRADMVVKEVGITAIVGSLVRLCPTHLDDETRPGPFSPSRSSAMEKRWMASTTKSGVSSLASGAVSPTNFRPALVEQPVRALRPVLFCSNPSAVKCDYFGDEQRLDPLNAAAC